jgi:hypothetical protein
MTDPADQQARRPRAVRVPRFVTNEEVGLGTAIHRLTSAVGVTPCGGCLKRATALNHRFVLTPRSHR